MIEKEEYKTLEEIKKLDNDLQNEIKEKELKMRILGAKIRQLYDFVSSVQRLGEIETMRIEELKDSDIK